MIVGGGRELDYVLKDAVIFNVEFSDFPMSFGEWFDIILK